MEASADRSTDARLVVYILMGLLAGALFVAFDMVAEQKIGTGTLTGALARTHAIVDHTVPLLIGPLLGVCAHYLQLRVRLSAVEERANRADALRMRLQKVERDQAVWVLSAAVLHELNNPLHALNLLLDEVAACADDEMRRVELIARAGAQSERALTHLRTLRAMGGDIEPELEDVPLAGILHSLAEDVRSLTGTDGVSVVVECEEPVVARVDQTYVRTILENLVDNSLQSLAGVRGGRILVRLSTEKGRAVVRVSDNGPDFPPEASALLFEPLRTTKRNGLGLGLPIARALARSMRGDLILENPAEKSFRLELVSGAQ